MTDAAELVALHHSYSWATGTPGTSVPLDAAPRYVRGARQGRWHRPRHGRTMTNPWESRPRTCVTLWCGQSINDLDACLTAGAPPPGEEACGTCEGRALGAGQDPTPDGLPPLTFTGNYGRPPTRCPASRREGYGLLMPGGRAATCRVCRDVVPMRASGGPYRSVWALATHPPGEGLVAPCPEHGWFHLLPDGPADVICECTRRRALHALQ